MKKSAITLEVEAVVRKAEPKEEVKAEEKGTVKVMMMASKCKMGWSLLSRTQRDATVSWFARFIQTLQVRRSGRSQKAKQKKRIEKKASFLKVTMF
jgi:hypothetical protein